MSSEDNSSTSSLGTDETRKRELLEAHRARGIKRKIAVANMRKRKKRRSKVSLLKHGPKEQHTKKLWSNVNADNSYKFHEDAPMGGLLSEVHQEKIHHHLVKNIWPFVKFVSCLGDGWRNDLRRLGVVEACWNALGWIDEENVEHRILRVRHWTQVEDYCLWWFQYGKDCYLRSLNKALEKNGACVDV